MKRRNFLHGLLLSGLYLFTGNPVKAASTLRTRRVLRVAHITDMHIFRDAIPEKGISQLLEKLDSMKDRPDFVLNTGDNVMDSLEHNKQDTLDQWDAWRSYFHSKLDYPLYNCIGNHDVWGWKLNDEQVKQEPDYGKVLAMKQLGLNQRYHHFEKKGWHFICLDSVFQDERGYIGRLDDEQFEWLEKQLSAIPKNEPVCLASHIPILAPSAFFDGSTQETVNWNVSASVMHTDLRKLKDLFYRHPNVKAALSGHLHLVDQANYLNMGYACNGAVSGNWWKGKRQEFEPNFALVDFYSDGSYDVEMVNYQA